jgi:hypothetical protein
MKYIYFLLAILLRILLLFPIIGSPLWYDENFTLLMIRRPLGQMLLATAGDVHPPLYYYLLWPLGQIPHASTWIIRIPSLLFSILALFVLWEVLERLTIGKLMRRATWVLFSISSVILYYTGEGRMYSWMILLVLCAVWCLLDRRWWLLGLTSGLLLWSHNYGIFYVATFWLAGLALDKHNWKPLTFSLSLAGLSFVPWCMVLLSQIKTIGGGYWIFWQTWPSILNTFYNSYVLYGQTIIDIYGQVIFFGWLTYSLIWLLLHYKSIDNKQAATIILAFGPFLMALLVSLTIQPILLYRALVPCVPFLTLILLSPSLEYLYAHPDNLRMKLAFIFIIPFMVINPTRLYFTSYHLRGINDQEIITALRTIESNWKPGDRIVHDGDGSIVDMLPYAVDPSDHYKLNPCGLTRGSLSPLTRQGLGIQLISPDQLHGHIWLVTEESPFTPACNTAWLSEFIHNIKPTHCIVDNYLQKSCLYDITTTP